MPPSGSLTRNSRSDRIERNLVGKNLAVLVGIWLAIDVIRIFRVIAQAMQLVVGIRCHTRCGEGKHRVQRRSGTFHRHFFKEVSIDVSVKGRLILHQIVSRALDGYGAGASRYRSEERRVGKEWRSRWSPY